MNRILVIDDDRAVRMVVTDALIDAGYAVAGAVDGADALDQMRAYPPDAILLDLRMPVMDGWTFLETMHQQPEWRDIPVGLISADPAVERTASAYGARVSVAKPFALDELLARVEHLVAQ